MNKPPSVEQWKRAPLYIRLLAVFIIWRETTHVIFYPPIMFSLRAGLVTFACLFALPLHPMSIPIAGGLGLSAGIYLWRYK
jgi:hypothetical protein